MTLMEKIRELDSNLPQTFEKTFIDAFNEVQNQYTAAGHADLPIREAIDYIHSYLHITIKAFKFQYGIPVCGGPIEVGFITNDRNFRWVAHKGFDSAIQECNYYESF